MMEDDPLTQVLQEWRAADPPPRMDARVMAAFRAARPAPWWSGIWRSRISIPVPVAAAVLFVAAIAAVLMQVHPSPTAAEPDVHVTRMESAGFYPLPNGAARVVKLGKQQ